MPTTIVSHISMNVNREPSLNALVHPMAQSFKTPAGGPYTTESVILPLGKSKADVSLLGNLHVEIRTVDGDGWPTATVIESATIAANSLAELGVGGGWIPRATADTTIPLVCELSGNTTYCLYLYLDAYDTEGFPQAVVRWFGLNNWTYTNGRPMRYRLPGFPPEGWEAWPTTYDLEFQIMAPTTIQKPTTPTPANGATSVDFASLHLDWVQPGAEPIMSFVYMGAAADDLWFAGIANQGVTEFAVDAEDVPKDGLVYWRVDVTDGENTVTGDVWNFDPRPAKATNPLPMNAATNQSIYVGASWDGSANTDTYDLYIALHDTDYVLAATDLTADEVEQIYTYCHLIHGTDYDWRIDAKNDFGTTQGDVWTFTTLVLEPPSASWELIPGGSGLGPWDIPPGVLGVDFRWVGDNSMTTTKRLVVAAMNRIWFEDV